MAAVRVRSKWLPAFVKISNSVAAGRQANVLKLPGMKDLLFLSHCVPNPPDKGEKIRAFHEVACLASRYRVHLACFARSEDEVRAANQLSGRCASVYVERLHPRRALLRAAVRFGFGRCLNMAFYWSAAMKAHVDSLAGRVPFAATLAYSAVMAPYAPRQLPLLFDMLDVDSEKWLQYAQSRRPGFLFRLEARRLRRWETYWSMAAQCTVLTTENEESLLHTFAPHAHTCFMENGVDGEYFDGVARPLPSGFEGRRLVVFVGTMDYHPNIEAAQWFATHVLPGLRREDPRVEFLIVGRNPTKDVRDLARLDGVTVAADVPDTRPYLAHARAIVVPLRLARGIQNKVLEALAMGRPVFASTAVCATFGKTLPAGVFCCASAAEFVERVSQACNSEPQCDSGIRAEACRRFSWQKGVDQIINRLETMIDATTPSGRS